MLKIKNLLLFLVLLVGSGSFAQEVYIINGETLELKEEVKGELSLLWTAVGEEQRYFVQKKDRMVELKDSLIDGRLQYRQELDTLAADMDLSVKAVDFNLPSLKHFVSLYNAQAQEDYINNASSSGIRMRLGFFTGLTNNSYVENPENVLVPLIGIGFEVFEPTLAPRHAALLKFRQSFERDDFRYSASQLSVDYRFKFLMLSNLSIFADAELFRLIYSRRERYVRDTSGEVIAVRDDSRFDVKAPLSFGIGADLKITEDGYITFGYNHLVSVFLDSNGSFPIDFTIGYKYEL